MGLFSGGFGTGLAEGLAESVDQSLKSAMDKRDKELSRARQFWETRQAQKMDLADEHDARASDALDLLINEFDGDIAKGLAAYQHFGTIDKVEAALAEADKTKAALGNYSMADKFNFEGIDLGQFADLSREDAFGAIRKEVKPVDIQMEDTGLLSKIGLGAKDMGGQVSAAINEVIPARTRNSIAGLTGAAYDASGTITSITQKRALEDNIKEGESRVFQLTRYIEKGQDSMGNKFDEHDILQFKKERDGIYEGFARIDIAKSAGDAATSGPTASSIISAHTKILSGLETDLQFNKTGNSVSILRDGEIIIDGAGDYWKEQSTAATVAFIKQNILDEDGKVKGVEEQEAVNLAMLTSELEIAQKEIAEAKAAEAAKGDDSETAETVTDDADLGPGDGAAPQVAEFTPVTVGTTGQVVNSQDDLDNYIRNFPFDYIDGAIAAGGKPKRDAIKAKLESLGVKPDIIDEVLNRLPADTV